MFAIAAAVLTSSAAQNGVKTCLVPWAKTLLAPGTIDDDTGATTARKLRCRCFHVRSAEAVFASG